MLKKNTLTILFLLALTISACTVSPMPTPTPIVEPANPQKTGNLPQTEADAPRVSVEDAMAALKNGTAIIVDVRSEQSYAAGHIEGAVSIPLTQIEADPGSLPLDKNLWIITYCTWLNEHTSARAAFVLLHNGFVNVSALLGGLEAWIQAGFPIEP